MKKTLLEVGKKEIYEEENCLVIENHKYSKILDSKIEKIKWILFNSLAGTALIILALVSLYSYINKTTLTCYKESATTETICEIEKTYSFQPKKETVLSPQPIDSIVLDYSDESCRITIKPKNGGSFNLTNYYSGGQCDYEDQIETLDEQIGSNQAFEKYSLTIKDNLFFWVVAICMIICGLCFFYKLAISGDVMYFVFNKPEGVLEVYKVKLFGEVVNGYTYHQIQEVEFQHNPNDDDDSPKGPHIRLMDGSSVHMVSFGSVYEREKIYQKINEYLGR